MGVILLEAYISVGSYAILPYGSRSALLRPAGAATPTAPCIATAAVPALVPVIITALFLLPHLSGQYFMKTVWG